MPSQEILPAGLKLPSILPEQRRSVIAIGNFDGVHEGHAFVLEEARRLAKKRNCIALALTFEPHPRRFFFPENPIPRLTPSPLKQKLLKARGMDYVVTLPFTQALSELSASSFIEDVLIQRFDARHIITGENFRFGHKGEGTPSLLRKYGADRGISVTTLPSLYDTSGHVLSSSRVRAALAKKLLTEANQILGYHWRAQERVVQGAQRGRLLGMPTANLFLETPTVLAPGIYAVCVPRAGVLHKGVASFGRRPVFDNGPLVLEVHLFDVSVNLYGEMLEILFVSYLRPEKSFESVAALTAQMRRDAEEARECLENFTVLSAFEARLLAEVL